MSWDISVFAASTPPPAVAQMPRDWRGEVLGSNAEVRARISAYLPSTDWSDPAWGLYCRGDVSLEFNLRPDEPNDGFMVHVRGGGEAVALLLGLATRTGWYLLDCSQGEWMHHSPDSGRGWHGFQEYRDRVLGAAGSEEDEPPA